MPYIKRIILTFIFLGVLGYVIYFVPPPKSWPDASILQILEFFIPLLFLITFLTDIFLDYLLKSFSIGLGGIVLITLESVGQLNIVTGVVAIIATALLTTSFKKPSLREKRAVLPLSRNERRQLKNI